MRLISIFITAFFAISCSETNMLQKSLLNLKAPAAYLHDSRIVNCNKTDSVSIIFNNKPLKSLTKVSRLKGIILPLIVFNYFETNMKVELGQNSIEENYNDFFINSLVDESRRTGCFGISDSIATHSNYSLEITIDTCKTFSRYQSTRTILFLFFAYSMSFNERGFPAETNLYVTVKLKKGNDLVSEKSYAINKTQPFLPAQNLSIDKLREEFNTNMVESLSLSSKECIEAIINDLNLLLQKNKPFTSQ